MYACGRKMEQTTSVILHDAGRRSQRGSTLWRRSFGKLAMTCVSGPTSWCREAKFGGDMCFLREELILGNVATKIIARERERQKNLVLRGTHTKHMCFICYHLAWRGENALNCALRNEKCCRMWFGKNSTGHNVPFVLWNKNKQRADTFWPRKLLLITWTYGIRVFI